MTVRTASDRASATLDTHPRHETSIGDLALHVGKGGGIGKVGACWIGFSRPLRGVQRSAGMVLLLLIDVMAARTLAGGQHGAAGGQHGALF